MPNLIRAKLMGQNVVRRGAMDVKNYVIKKRVKLKRRPGRKARYRHEVKSRPFMNRSPSAVATKGLMPGSKGEMLVAGPSTRLLEGGVLPHLRQEIRSLQPKAKEIANRVVRLHEKFELQAAKELRKRKMGPASASVASHISPSVLLREHNLMRSLKGEDADRVRQVLKKVRQGEGSSRRIRKAVPGVRIHGKNQPRYSRHAIKRMEQIFASKKTY
jgi:hypothetical protein